MNGAMAVPLVKTMSTPKTNNTIIIGNNQNFLRTFKKSHKSLKNSIFKPCLAIILKWFLQISSHKGMIACFHDRSIASLKLLQQKGILPKQSPEQGDGHNDNKENN